MGTEEPLRVGWVEYAMARSLSGPNPYWIAKSIRATGAGLALRMPVFLQGTEIWLAMLTRLRLETNLARRTIR
jgi:hypothetical protein